MRSRYPVGLLLLVTVAPSALAEDSKPTREAFLGEVLDAKPTAVTSKFDDYTPGSYHIDNNDLLKGLTEEAPKRKLVLRAVLIFGPMPDPLWTSYVTVFIKEKDGVRVNHLVMPHARITQKGTGLLPVDRYEKLMAGLLDSGLPEKEPPAGGKAKDKAAPLLMAIWDADGKAWQVYTGDLLKDPKKLEKFGEAYDGLLKDLKKSYPEGD
jgi:hypothetical protein